MRTILSVLLLAPTVAAAVPMQFDHQGRLFDALGVPLDGDNDLSFAIYDVSSGGVALWTEAHDDVAFTDGYFSVELGSTSALDSATFDGGALYLGMSVNAGTETGRIALVSVPYAVRAQVADSAESLDGSITWSQISDPVAGTDTLSTLTCGAGESVFWTGADWSCQFNAQLIHNHNAGDVVSGVLSVDRLPVGGASTDVAAGDHVHSDLASASHGHSDLAAATHGHDDLTLTGGIVIGSDSTCDAAGKVVWDSATSSLQVCDGTDWRTVSASSAGFFGSAGSAMAAGLTHYWLFDGAGGMTEPAGFGGKALTMSGGGWVGSQSPFTGIASAGDRPQVADFDGSNDYTNDAHSLITNSSYTVLLWVYLDAANPAGRSYRPAENR